MAVKNGCKKKKKKKEEHNSNLLNEVFLNAKNSKEQ